MILEALRKLSEAERLVDDPAFEIKPVRWVIEIDRAGKFRDVYDTQEPEILPPGSKKKPRLFAKLMRIPRRQGRSSGIRADFLVDNAKYALGVSIDSEDPRLADCHDAFVKLLHEAPADIVEMRSLIAFMGDKEQHGACAAKLAEEKTLASNDLLSFFVEGTPVAAAPALEAWWSARQASSSEEATPVQCLLCGLHKPPARLHGSIQVRGASTSGVPLVSFNKDAFEKYGWSGSENAPVCNACMTAYTEALRRLTRSQYEAPDGRKLQPQQTLLNEDTTAVYWSDQTGLISALVRATFASPKEVEELLFSPRSGKEVLLRDTSRFYCLILTGTQGRVAIRRMHTGTVGEVVQNLLRFYAAIRIARHDAGAPLPIQVLLRALAVNGEYDRLAPDMASELWLSALFGLRLSHTFLATLVTRNRVEVSDSKTGRWKVGRERAALLQYYFISHGQSPSRATTDRESAEKELSPMPLDEASCDRAYVLGRILATAERMQQLAQPQGLNRTVADRFFPMASVQPKVVFSQLMELYKAHHRKAMRDIRGAALATDTLWLSIITKLNLDAFANPLTLEEQGRFGLGYYHQKREFVEQAIARRAQQKNIGTTDDVENSEEIEA